MVDGGYCRYRDWRHKTCNFLLSRPQAFTTIKKMVNLLEVNQINRFSHGPFSTTCCHFALNTCCHIFGCSCWKALPTYSAHRGAQAVPAFNVCYQTWRKTHIHKALRRLLLSGLEESSNQNADIWLGGDLKTSRSLLFVSTSCPVTHA